MMEVHERRFHVNGRLMAARCWHDSQLPPILALHGWLDNAATFDRLAPYLSNYHVVALDFAGHGYSEHRAQGVRYHLVDHLDDVLAVVKQLAWTSFTLMGHSMGAGIAVLFSAAMPDAINKLVLIEGLGPYTGQVEDSVQHLSTALNEWQHAHQGTSRILPSFDHAVKARMNGLLPVGEQAARLLCQRGTKQVADGLVWTADKRLRLSSPTRFSEQQVCAYLSAIQCPTLLISAENTLPFDRTAYQQRINAIKQLTHVQLAGGHHLHLDDNVDGVAQVLTTFLQTATVS
ncbi:alpha/beta fold hydrolase [Agitococcus lubricus]|uniref:Epoxide hydrolase n=1 Tax=Agitococcus lubricus TaxID=1077255 RepID=A0A2T5ISE3_9GAMM|nr:alpha/beta hydrolase [Agitococcus lubricus]PTQ86744.1 epoxide hydrolase [Agitococcus lubricus]